jgi:hypothetical protein
VKAPSEIVGKSVEEIITSWNAELVRSAWLALAAGLLLTPCTLAGAADSRVWHARAGAGGVGSPHLPQPPHAGRAGG